MANWFQMWVRHKDSMVDQIAVMKRCDPALQELGCVPNAPDGIPVVQEGGVIEVRGYSEMGFKMSKRYLQGQGFEIIREQENT